MNSSNSGLRLCGVLDVASRLVFFVVKGDSRSGWRLSDGVCSLVFFAVQGASKSRGTLRFAPGWWLDGALEKRDLGTGLGGESRGWCCCSEVREIVAGGGVVTAGGGEAVFLLGVKADAAQRRRVAMAGIFRELWLWCYSCSQQRSKSTIGENESTCKNTLVVEGNFAEVSVVANHRWPGFPYCSRTIITSTSLSFLARKRTFTATMCSGGRHILPHCGTLATTIAQQHTMYLLVKVLLLQSFILEDAMILLAEILLLRRCVREDARLLLNGKYCSE